MTNAVCPICGYKLIEDDSYDISIDISECCVYIVGHCENCGKEYKWKNIFSFSYVDEIKEC